jgi:hypothetical protein
MNLGKLSMALDIVALPVPASLLLTDDLVLFRLALYQMALDNGYRQFLISIGIRRPTRVRLSDATQLVWKDNQSINFEVGLLMELEV